MVARDGAQWRGLFLPIKEQDGTWGASLRGPLYPPVGVPGSRWALAPGREWDVRHTPELDVSISAA